MAKNAPPAKTLRLVCHAEDAGQLAAEVSARLGAHVEAQFGPRAERPLGVYAQDGAGALVGGLNGATHWRWLYVRQLWVADAFRQQGLGAKLLAEAETEAQARGCIGVYIDTFDPAVADFYERRGFSRVGAIADFPPGAQRIFLSKQIG